MRYRTRVVELARRGARAAADNNATVHDASRSADERGDFRRLFLAHYARIRATCLAFAEPGVALFAFSRDDGSWQGSMCLAARPGELRAGVIGRHSAADLFLADAPTLALRHLVLLLEPLPLRAALRGEVRFRLMDLETDNPPRDEHGRAVTSLTAEGPVFLTCDRFALLAFVTGDPTDWPDRAADAWDIQPERIFVDERLAEGSAPRQRPRPPSPPSAHRASTVIRLLDGPRHLAAATDDPADGHFHLASAHGRLRLPVGDDALRRGLLVGRYERCHNHADSPVLDTNVSRVHLLLVDVAGRPVAIDLASSNGTFLVDLATAALTDVRVHHLAPGDLLALAGPRTVLSWHPAAR
jgi:hypothetical protein